MNLNAVRVSLMQEIPVDIGIGRDRKERELPLINKGLAIGIIVAAIIVLILIR